MSTQEEPVLSCPHCNEYIIMEKLNCAIFRHGIFIQSGNQINPHASKMDCDRYSREKVIYGCGKPFRVIKINDKFITEICEYI